MRASILTWVGLAVALLGRGTRADEPTPDQPESKATAPRLSVLSSDGKWVDTPQKFDFGMRSQVDDKQTVQDIIDLAKQWYVLPGVKHDFQVRNDSGQRLTIAFARDLSPCAFPLGGAVFLKNGNFIAAPFDLAPGEIFTTRISFDFYNAATGRQGATLNLYGPKDQVLANFTLEGLVENGIKSSPAQIDFGQIPLGHAANRTLNLVFDKRIPRSVPIRPFLRLTTNLAYASVVVMAVPGRGKEVQVRGDTIRFTVPAATDFTADLPVSAQLQISKDAPPGPFQGEVKLEVVGMPMYSLTQSTRFSFKGEVVGPSTQPTPKINP